MTHGGRSGQREEKRKRLRDGGHGADRPTDATVRSRAFLALCLATLGVVYGDIGTSPLYTMGEIFFGQGDAPRTPENAVGATSLVLWLLILSVSAKYIIFVLRASNQGHGGTFALLALVKRAGGWPVVLLTPALILAAGLLYGEGIITPAISVLSAVEGLRVATDAFEPYIVLITVVILSLLFAIQRRGTASIGRVFGPVMLVWFVTIAVIGLVHITLHPGILWAVNPVSAVSFLVRNGLPKSVGVLGSVLLAVTGCEALYADMGHFGASPIRTTWLRLVFPALMLNYLGQGAYILGDGPVAGGHVFYALVPRWGLYPMVALATVATIIASQALISGAYSLTQQGIAMGLFPRVRIVHTSGTFEGQIYVPAINSVLWIACVLLVIWFQQSTKLAAAYGFAVSGVMLVTSLSMLAVARKIWGWNIWKAAGVFGSFAAIEAVLFAAASSKVLAGGWVPLVIGAFLFAVMTTWQWGRTRIAAAYAKIAPTCETIEQLEAVKRDPTTVHVPRPIVVMSSRPVLTGQDRIPPVLHLFGNRLQAWPKHVLFLNVAQESVPEIAQHNQQRYDVACFMDDPTQGSLWSVRAHYGYMEAPDVRRALAAAKERGKITIPGDPHTWIVMVGQENVLDATRNYLIRLRLSFFRLLLRNSVPAHLYLGLGSDTLVSTETVHITEGGLKK
jgi:KUP system potassium uptake protein